MLNNSEECFALAARRHRHSHTPPDSTVHSICKAGVTVINTVHELQVMSKNVIISIFGNQVYF